MKVLWLTTWYPDRLVFHNGDFIERYAKAISKRLPVVVLYVTKDLTLKAGKYEIDRERNGNLTVYRGYYGMKTKSTNFLNRLLSAYRYFKMFNRLYKQALKNERCFDIVHVQVAFRAGLFALWLKFTKRIKYLLTEHSSWFMPPAYVFSKESFITRWLTKKVIINAHGLHVVSDSLGVELKRLELTNKPYTVIPNVVDTLAFYPASVANNLDITNWVTITGNIFQKNTEGVLRAFAKVLKQGCQAVLHIVGPNGELLVPLIEQLNIQPNIVLHGAIPNARVADINRKCDAMIFFSRYETFGIAMAEAFCCGLPVIASQLPVIKENLIEGINGMLVESENETELAQTLIYMYRNPTLFNKQHIAADAMLKYSYDAISKSFEDWYKNFDNP